MEWWSGGVMETLFQLVLMYCEIEAQEKVIKQLLGEWARRASRSFSTFIFLQLSFQFVNLAPFRCSIIANLVLSRPSTITKLAPYQLSTIANLAFS